MMKSLQESQDIEVLNRLLRINVVDILRGKSKSQRNAEYKDALIKAAESLIRDGTVGPEYAPQDIISACMASIRTKKFANSAPKGGVLKTSKVEKFSSIRSVSEPVPAIKIIVHNDLIKTLRGVGSGYQINIWFINNEYAKAAIKELTQVASELKWTSSLKGKPFQATLEGNRLTVIRLV